jgi:hypothetical protein
MMSQAIVLPTIQVSNNNSTHYIEAIAKSFAFVSTELSKDKCFIAHFWSSSLSFISDSVFTPSTIALITCANVGIVFLVAGRGSSPSGIGVIIKLIGFIGCHLVNSLLYFFVTVFLICFNVRTPDGSIDVFGKTIAEEINKANDMSQYLRRIHDFIFFSFRI